MKNILQVTIGQYSTKGNKEVNQDFHGISVPNEYLLKYKGIAIALADGISSSDVSDIASKISVNSFLEDYYCTSQTWSVKKSASRILTATNSWLYSQTKKSIHSSNKDKGYICTLSSIILKSTTAHIFHLGDSRIYRVRDKKIEQLSQDHRLWVSSDKSYLSRAMGMDSQLTIDYDSIPIEKNDIFILSTDGVYEYLEDNFLLDNLEKYENDYEKLAKFFVDTALKNGSNDNLTIQIVRIDNIPNKDIKDINKELENKPLPPMLEARKKFDGYTIIRNISSSPRSHVYLASDEETKENVILKIPSIELQEDKAYLERFLLEDWIAKKINNEHVVKSFLQTRKKNFLYNVSEYIQGQTLTQWIKDNPKPKLENVRNIIEQIAKGLYAFHNLEMLHQDLRPENVLIDESDSVKIIDFGSTRVEGIADIDTVMQQHSLQGTALYSAPEYFLGYLGTNRSDIFSLGVITYQMLSGKFPYGTNIAKCENARQQKKLKYTPLYEDENSKIPLWIDEALKKALAIDPNDRYSEISEFIYDLRNPNKKFLNKTKPALIERNPLIFWQSISLILGVIVFFQFLYK
ncbi:MAG: protein kinase [Arcobacter sp.]|nr:protein kinase [Arcobacter sp.]|tara:strand:+ start:5757 stop:7484 length:1728 start_codon:yes stop_codon:yes gene_type:complete